MSSKNNNQINIPQAREAMDRFKMQAASEEDVFLHHKATPLCKNSKRKILTTPAFLPKFLHNQG